MTEITEDKHLSDVPTDISSIKRPWGKLAHGISLISNPLFVAFPTFLVIAVATAPDLPRALLWWAITVIGISIAPLLFIWRGVRLGRYSDHHVSIREQRFIPLLFGLGSVAIVFALLLILHTSRPLIATVTAVIVVLVLSTVNYIVSAPIFKQFSVVNKVSESTTCLLFF